MAVKSNDLKKGDKVVMKNGWGAVVMDNKKGNIRCLEVNGYYKEMGDEYVWNIGSVVEMGGKVCNESIELSPAQAKAKSAINAMGF